MTFTILHGDNRHTLKTLADNSVDAIVTDPPYGIDFLGKAWDANTGALETYRECLRVLKPGGHILAFSAARTYHHLAVTLEQAGFEIRDQIMWIYSSGFPKSQDVGRQLHKKENGKPDKQRYHKDLMTKVGDNYKHNQTGKIYRILPDINGDRLEKSHEGEGYGYIFEEIIEVNNAWSGWGTALKPAHEPIALARKPLKQSIARNVQEWGTGALNIDATRVAIEGADTRGGGSNGWDRVEFGEAKPNKYDGEGYQPNDQGRFPSNVIGELPLYQKYFYCPKVSRKERHVGFDDPGPQTARERDEDGNVLNRPAKKAGASANVLVEQFQLNDIGNNHPTVKPVALMEYLIKLITPPGGTVLDPFCGSGSTGMAAVALGHTFIGCEQDESYVRIAETRIAAWKNKDQPPANPLWDDLFSED